jgi:2-keto-4-pentenoate hydratase/2-oxohepta-3-ene-1,7-dioic acid hydratase in catechol pathway
MSQDTAFVIDPPAVRGRDPSRARGPRGCARRRRRGQRGNGEVWQRSDLDQLIWSVPDTIAYLSSLFRLLPGDLIYTGTPAGVAAVSHGDVLEASVAGLPKFTTRIV